ncbi:MAG: DUF1992 domain-containing protein [Micrococcaceae bacterium]|nr:DUF1992 domain-containing protein [Micrococcaceae bacterium]
MPRHNTEENRDAPLHAARYSLARDSADGDVPVDEYAQSTGRQFITNQDEPSASPNFHADDEVWEVANNALDAAFARGDFDNLAYAGKPIPGLGSDADPDWWVKAMMQRENISGVGPPALMLRKEDAELEASLDRLRSTAQVRDLLVDFNARIIEARRQLSGGPPVITKLRDIEIELWGWEQRRLQRDSGSGAATTTPVQRRARWWKRYFGVG